MKLAMGGGLYMIYEGGALGKLKFDPMTKYVGSMELWWIEIYL